MKLENHDNRDDDKKVWLRSGEVDELLSVIDDTTRRVAVSLGVRCGLRASEVVAVTPEDVAQTPIGDMIDVWEGKGDKHRQVPLPADLAATIDAVADVRDAPSDIPLADVSTRSFRRWVTNAAGQLVDDDKRWQYLGPHDLRRTWGTLLTTEYEVEPGLVMEWGGWDNWETFREHYLGAYSLDAQQNQMEKVDWL